MSNRNALRGLLALALVIGGLVTIAISSHPAVVLLGVAIEVVAGVLFGINFVRTARCRT